MLPQFTTMNVIDGQAGLMSNSSLIFYSLTIDNILNIIVLLILAGVTIATLTGNNGIITRANQAKTETEQAEKEEKYDLEKQADFINEYANGIEVEQVTDENPGVLETESTDTYVINSIEDLVFFAHDVTNGNTYEGKTVKLGLSIDFNSTKSYVDPLRTDYGKYGYNGELKTLLTSGEGFKSIGTTYDEDISTNYFGGTFDGNKNIIYNLYQNFEDSENTSIIGFFSTNAGEIKNLIIENANISSLTNNMHIVTGILVGRNKGVITNCGVSGNSKVTDNGVKSIYCAGIAGQAMGTIEKCFSKANIELDSNNRSSLNIGGISGALTENYIKSCYNTGSINITLNSDIPINVGGIAGYNTKKIENSYNTGKISLKAYSNITKSLCMANIIASSNAAESEVINCFNIGEINIDILEDNDNIYISNIAGVINYGNINNCYNIGKINTKSITFKKIGQIIGNVYKGNINNCKGIIDNPITAIGNELNSVINNVTVVKKEEIPDILQVIGEDFKLEESNNYPILNWQ